MINNSVMNKIIEKLLGVLGKIPNDKLLHFTISLIIFEISFKLLNLIKSIDINSKYIIAAFITVFVIICKEIYDSSKKEHSFELLDIISGVIGLLVGYLIMII